MTAPARQLTLDLPLRTAFGVEDFLVSGANLSAVEAIDSWPRWNAPAYAVTGPPGSGKSHLVHVWQSNSGASVVDFSVLDEQALAPLSRGHALAIEDIDRSPAAGNQRLLFHALNLAREHRGSLLLTARARPGEIAFDLPDLRSRIRALPAVTIEAPDDALLNGLLVKLFSDRQLRVEPNVITYLVRNMERSAEAASAIVVEIDRRSLETGRRVTRPLAVEVVKSLGMMDNVAD